MLELTFLLYLFWGKFGERPNKLRTRTLQSPAALHALLDDETTVIKMLRIVSKEILEAVTVDVDDNAKKGTRTNIFIASFTICNAHLKLCDALDVLKAQVLYYDTDSVIYRWKPGLPEIPTGVFIGEMTGETDEDMILDFARGGAKNYGYGTQGGKVECKVRGFTLNVRGAALLNFQNLKTNILAELEDPKEE